MNICVTDYDPRWPDLFAAEAERLRRILGGNLAAVFHIGSTAVPGLRAKPIIDIMPAALDLDEVDRRRADFEALGYEALGEFGIPGRRYFRKGGDERTHQIHVFRHTDAQALTRHLAFRDYLRSHGGVARAYANLKTELARRYPTDIDGYCLGKEDFVRRVESDALRWYWETYEIGR